MNAADLMSGPERSCFTCRHAPAWPTPGCDALTMDEDEDEPIIDYCEASGANTELGNGYPLDRSIACPGWAPPTTASDAQSVAAVTPAADVSRDPAAPEKHGGGGSSWAAEVEAEWRAERAATLDAVADDDAANARAFERATRPENFNAGVRVYGDPYGDVRQWLRVAR